MGGEWLTILGRINTVAAVNQALGTTRYDLTNIDDVPTDIIQLCISRSMGAPGGSSD